MSCIIINVLIFIIVQIKHVKSIDTANTFDWLHYQPLIGEMIKRSLPEPPEYLGCSNLCSCMLEHPFSSTSPSGNAIYYFVITNILEHYNVLSFVINFDRNDSHMSFPVAYFFFKS